MKLSDFLKEVNRSEEDIINYSGEEALEAVKKNGSSLKYAHNQTLEICLEAVREDGLALQYIHEQTPEICLAAVKQTSWALQFVDKSIFDEETVTIELTKEQLNKIKHLI
jgi:hypothetical protein